MSLVGEFDKGRALFEPLTVIERVEGFPKVAVASFSRYLIDEYVSRNQCRIIGEIHSANGSLPIYETIIEEERIALFMCCVGAATCACQMEEIIAMGAEKLIYFGSCGVLDRNLAPYGLIIPTHALRDEGCSYHYIENSKILALQPSGIEYLEEFFKSVNVKYSKGQTWTIDAIYRETPKKIDYAKSLGCICVEMECSALSSVAQFRGKEFAQFLFAADNLDCSEWESRNLLDGDKSIEAELLSLALLAGARWK